MAKRKSRTRKRSKARKPRKKRVSGALLRHTIRRLDPRIKSLAVNAHKQFVVYQRDTAPFWLLHGANMMASDYDEGKWTPLFEEIYEEDAVFPSMEKALDVAIQKFWSEEADAWLGIGRAIGAWLVLDDQQKFGYYLSGLVELQRGDDLPSMIRKPHNDTIWRMFNALKRQVLAVQEDSHGVEESGPESGPEVQQQPVGGLVGT